MEAAAKNTSKLFGFTSVDLRDELEEVGTTIAMLPNLEIFSHVCLSIWLEFLRDV